MNPLKNWMVDLQSIRTGGQDLRREGRCRRTSCPPAEALSRLASLVLPLAAWT